MNKTDEPKADMSTASGRYSALVSKRQPFLDRARANAQLTIPAVFPPQGKYTADLPQPINGIGPRGVANLASKLLVSLFPSNVAFFRYRVDEYALDEMERQLDPNGENDLRADAEKAFSQRERSISSEVPNTALGSHLWETFKHLLIGGNGTLYLDPVSGQPRLIPLWKYVVRRDAMGNLLEWISEEEMAFNTLPKQVQDEYRASNTLGHTDQHDDVKVYTHVIRVGDVWRVKQEIDGTTIESTRGQFPLDKLPWIVLRLIRVDGEDYGRGFVEEHYGDLESLEFLNKAIRDFSEAAAKVVFLRKPNATTKIKALQDAKSGDFVNGSKDDIDVLQLEKYADFQVAAATVDKITERLSYAFLMHTAIQRDAERVTAEEVRVMSYELDSGLGGIHSLLSQDLQLAIVTLIEHRLTRSGDLPELPKGLAKPQIVTGVDALGRTSDLQNLNVALGYVTQLGEQGFRRLKMGNLLKYVFATANVPSDTFIKSDDEINAEEQAAMIQQLAAQATPNAVNAIATTTTQQG